MSEPRNGVVLSGFGTVADFLSPTLSLYQVTSIQRQLCHELSRVHDGLFPTL